MFTETHYVPVLKSRWAELNALSLLGPEVRAALTPMIEIMPVPWDPVEERDVRTLPDHLATVSSKLVGIWDTEHEAFLDLLHLDDPDLDWDAYDPVVDLFARMRLAGIQAVPTTGLKRSPAYQSAVGEVVALDRRGLCLRLSDSDVLGNDTFPTRIDELLLGLGIQRNEVVLVIDAGVVSPWSEDITLNAFRSVLRRLPHLHDWGALVLLGTSFPTNLCECGANTISARARAEWSVWRRLGPLPRRPAFGDYGIDYPDLVQSVDFQATRAGAHVCYTCDDYWLIAKGGTENEYADSQFLELVAELVSRPDFLPAGFSWGDDYLRGLSTEAGGLGAVHKWRQAGYSHHLAFVARQVAEAGAAWGAG